MVGSGRAILLPSPSRAAVLGAGCWVVELGGQVKSSSYSPAREVVGGAFTIYHLFSIKHEGSIFIDQEIRYTVHPSLYVRVARGTGISHLSSPFSVDRLMGCGVFCLFLFASPSFCLLSFVPLVLLLLGFGLACFVGCVCFGLLSSAGGFRAAICTLRTQE